MNRYFDGEGHEIHLGHHVAVWDNWYKKMFRCEVIGFTPQKVRIKAFKNTNRALTTLKNPGDLLIIKK